MIPISQSRRSPQGDCLRACIASLLEVGINDVPDFISARDNPGDDYPAWYIEIQSWLKERGYGLSEFQLDKDTQWRAIMPWPMWCIFLGPHPTGIRHAIVGQIEGKRFIPKWDPLDDLTDTDAAKSLVGVDGVVLLVPLDPSKLKMKIITAVEIIDPNDAPLVTPVHQ